MLKKIYSFISGSVIGTLGGLLLGVVSESILIPLLVIILLISSYKIWTHKSKLPVKNG